MGAGNVNCQSLKNDWMHLLGEEQLSTADQQSLHIVTAAQECLIIVQRDK